MALEMKETSGWWYARLTEKKKLRRFYLMESRDGKQQRIPIEGRRPSSIKEWQSGDAAFINSYNRALAAHNNPAGRDQVH